MPEDMDQEDAEGFKFQEGSKDSVNIPLGQA